jgi:hypothetical protein
VQATLTDSALYVRQLRRRIMELEVWQQQARAQAAQQEQQQQHASLKRGGGGDGQQDKDQGVCGGHTISGFGFAHASPRRGRFSDDNCVVACVAAYGHLVFSVGRCEAQRGSAWRAVCIVPFLSFLNYPVLV